MSIGHVPHKGVWRGRWGGRLEPRSGHRRLPPFPIMSTANPTGTTNAAQEEDPDALLQEISELLSVLRNNEKKWRDRHEMLEKEGYVLRPRLQPGWTPSWLQSGKNPLECEDGEPLPVEVPPNHHNHRVDVFIGAVQTCGRHPQRKW